MNRRQFTWGATALALISASAARAQQATIAGLFAGRIDDGGFMEAGYRGLVLAREKGAAISYIDGVQPQRELLEAALRKLAAAKPAMIVAHGGQNNEAAKTVAAEFPDIMFVVTQGNVTGPNLSSYEVLQEDSAFLAGMLAGLTTKTGVVGHMSGIRVVPGLKGRAAFANGLAYAAPQVKLLTNFSDNQDDSSLSKRVALAIADQGADVIFTMLNAGRVGAVDACRERGIAQIGNVLDWIPRAPDVFIGSAIADSGLAVLGAAQDKMSGAFKPGRIEKIGLQTPAAVRLTMADRVPAAVRQRIDEAARDIASGKLVVSTQWSGPEFQNPPSP